MNSSENFEAAKLLRALSRALNNGDISMGFMDAAKAVVADGIEQDNFCIYMRCKIDKDYPMEDYMVQAEIDLANEKSNHIYPENEGGDAPVYPH